MSSPSNLARVIVLNPSGLLRVLHPTRLLEVLSPSTRVHDRKEKLECYQRIPSLQQDVLVHQDCTPVELLSRQGNGVWLPTVYQGRDTSVELASIGVTLPLEEVFDGVDMPPPGASNA